MLSNDYIQDVLGAKDVDRALATGQNVSWSTRDGAVVIFDLDDPPAWLPTPAPPNDKAAA